MAFTPMAEKARAKAMAEAEGRAKAEAKVKAKAGKVEGLGAKERAQEGLTRRTMQNIEIAKSKVSRTETLKGATQN